MTNEEIIAEFKKTIEEGTISGYTKDNVEIALRTALDKARAEGWKECEENGSLDSLKTDDFERLRRNNGLKPKKVIPEDLPPQLPNEGFCAYLRRIAPFKDVEIKETDDSLAEEAGRQSAQKEISELKQQLAQKDADLQEQVRKLQDSIDSTLKALENNLTGTNDLYLKGAIDGVIDIQRQLPRIFPDYKKVFEPKPVALLDNVLLDNAMRQKTGEYVRKKTK